MSEPVVDAADPVLRAAFEHIRDTGRKDWAQLIAETSRKPPKSCATSSKPPVGYACPGTRLQRKRARPATAARTDLRRHPAHCRIGLHRAIVTSNEAVRAAIAKENGFV